ncbi:hypothetical protein PC114_g23459, partial [Phytophthora cactorum]
MDAGQRPESDPDAVNSYEEVLERWVLDDCIGFRDLVGDDGMKALFVGWQKTHSKLVAVT